MKELTGDDIVERFDVVRISTFSWVLLELKVLPDTQGL